MNLGFGCFNKGENNLGIRNLNVPSLYVDLKLGFGCFSKGEKNKRGYL